MKQSHKKQFGFSLIELLVIAGVTGLSLTVAGTYLYSINSEMRKKAIVSEANQLTKQLEFVFTRGPTCTKNFQNLELKKNSVHTIPKIIKWDENGPTAEVLIGETMKSKELTVKDDGINLTGTHNLGSSQFAGKLNITYTPTDPRFAHLSFRRSVGIAFRMAGPLIEKCAEGLIDAEDAEKVCQMLYGLSYTSKDGQCIDKYKYEWFTGAEPLMASCPAGWEPRYQWDSGAHHVWGQESASQYCATAYPAQTYTYAWIHSEFFGTDPATGEYKYMPGPDAVTNQYADSSGTDPSTQTAPMVMNMYIHSEKKCRTVLSSRLQVIPQYSQWHDLFVTKIQCRQLR